MKIKNKYFLLLLSVLPYTSNAARILSIFGVPIATQYAFIEPLLKELAARGHEITSITNFPQKQKQNNFRDIVIEKNKHLFDDYQNFTMEYIDINYYKVLEDFYNITFKICLNILNDPSVRQVIDSEKFDLIILEVFLMESFFGLGELLQAPMIGVSYFGSFIPVDDMVSNISPLSYVPEMIIPLKEMNFWQRLINLLVHFIEWMHYYTKYMPVQKQIYNFCFPNSTLTFEEALKNVSLVLLNDHFSLTLPRPYVPNMIEVAGLNIQTKHEPLVNDLKVILDNATEGVIVMDFDPAMDLHIVDLFLYQFKKMPQVILWKSAQNIRDKPSNVYINNTFNIPSILFHANIKLYVTSSNYLSIIESVYHGLPIMTVISTKNKNDIVDYIHKVGIGLSIKLHNISEKKLAHVFRELLSTSHYREMSKTLSSRFRDQQNSPMEKAIYWIEYVLRHNGAAHLKNKGQYLTWWQFYNIDVCAAILTTFIFVVILFFVIFKNLLECFCEKFCSKKITVKKKHD